MRVLVLGGTGFIGSRVVTRLAGMGHEVAVFNRGRTKADLPLRVRRLIGDQAELGDHVQAFRDFAPDVVVGMRLMTEREANAFAGAFAGLACRALVIGSMDVYRAYNRLRRVEPGPPDPTPLTEDSPVREKLYPYREFVSEPWAQEYDKLLVERVVMSAPGLPGTVLRLPFVYGPGDGLHRLAEYLKPMDEGLPAIVMDERRARWRAARGYVENVAEAIALAVTDPRATGRVYNVADAEAFTEREWALNIGRAAGWKGEVVTKPKGQLPADLVKEYDFSQHLFADTRRVRTELGYREPVTLAESLRRTIEWERRSQRSSDDQA